MICQQESEEKWRKSVLGTLVSFQSRPVYFFTKWANAVSGRPWRWAVDSQESSRQIPLWGPPFALGFWGRAAPVRRWPSSCRVWSRRWSSCCTFFHLSSKRWRSSHTKTGIRGRGQASAIYTERTSGKIGSGHISQKWVEDIVNTPQHTLLGNSEMMRGSEEM